MASKLSVDALGPMIESQMAIALSEHAAKLEAMQARLDDEHEARLKAEREVEATLLKVQADAKEAVEQEEELREDGEREAHLNRLHLEEPNPNPNPNPNWRRI